MQFVPAAALGWPGLLVAENWEVIGVGCLGPDDRIVQYVTVRMHLMTGNDGPVRIAKQARVHPGKVPEIREVLDLPRRVAPPAVWTGGHDRPAVVLELGHLGQWPARLFERNPDKPVTLLRAKRRHARFRWHPERVRQLRDRDAAPIGVITPAVIGAHDLIAVDRAE